VFPASEVQDDQLEAALWILQVAVLSQPEV
jgi:hypothetical protein